MNLTDPHDSRSAFGTALAALLAIAAGLGIAWVDVRADEVIVSVVPLLLVGALLGLARPRWPWVWGPLVGIWIPIAHWTGMFGSPKAPSPAALGPLLALIPPTLAAFAAATLERGLLAFPPQE